MIEELDTLYFLLNKRALLKRSFVKFNLTKKKSLTFHNDTLLESQPPPSESGHQGRVQESRRGDWCTPTNPQPSAQSRHVKKKEIKVFSLFSI